MSDLAQLIYGVAALLFIAGLLVLLCVIAAKVFRR
jgi:hypothetical protein